MDVTLDNASKQVIEISLNGVDVFSIIASVFSIVLGIVAIWLSVLFYKMSDKSSREIENASKSIDSSVKRLDIVFEKMYTDTFGMVKDTVSDMRKYVYKSNGKEEISEESTSEVLASEIEKKTKDLVDEAINELQADKLSESDVEELVKKVIRESTNVAKKFESDSIINKIKILLEVHGGLTYDELNQLLFIKNDSVVLFNALEEMVELQLIVNPFNVDENGDIYIRNSKKINLK